MVNTKIHIQLSLAWNKYRLLLSNLFIEFCFNNKKHQHLSIIVVFCALIKMKYQRHSDDFWTKPGPWFTSDYVVFIQSFKVSEIVFSKCIKMKQIHRPIGNCNFKFQAERLGFFVFVFVFVFFIYKQVWTQNCAVQKASVDVNISYY